MERGEREAEDVQDTKYHAPLAIERAPGGVNSQIGDAVMDIEGGMSILKDV